MKLANSIFQQSGPIQAPHAHAGPRMSEQDRLRAKLAHEYAPKLAELMYQVDKGSRHAKLDDLLTDSTRQAYIDAAIGALLGLQKTRIQAVQAVIAQHHAERDKPAEDMAVQARKDIAKYGKDVH